MNMNPNVKSLWVRALRSGDYAQTKGYLRTTEGYCCLGVLCDLASANGVPLVWEGPTDQMVDRQPVVSYGVFVDSAPEENTVLPVAVRRWAGLDEENPIVQTLDGEEHALSVFNDGSGNDYDVIPQHTFVQIADLIERSL